MQPATTGLALFRASSGWEHFYVCASQAQRCGRQLTEEPPHQSETQILEIWFGLTSTEDSSACGSDRTWLASPHPCLIHQRDLEFASGGIKFSEHTNLPIQLVICRTPQLDLYDYRNNCGCSILL